LKRPYIIQFKSIGSSDLGYLSVAEENNEIPFKLKRAYWTYYTPQDVARGGHANINKELVLVAVAGNITINIEMLDGFKKEFTLSRPHEGLYIPKLCWHTMYYSHNAVQLVLASNLYTVDDYIRSYEIFKEYKP
jgi:hypothetical protein